jgi:hypothetical protein
MPLLNVEVPHSLAQSEATKRLNNKHAEIKEKNTYTVTNLSETWVDSGTLEFSFKIYGFSITGSVHSLEHSVKMSVDIPLAAMMMRGMIESQIKTELTQVLS